MSQKKTNSSTNKCHGEHHIFFSNQRYCVCGQADRWYFPCSRCGKLYASRYMDIPCNDCLEDPTYLRELEARVNQPTGVFFKKYREVTAFGYDRKTGQPLALDSKGKRVDPSQTRYDLRQDPHGWKVTGKKVRGKDELGRPNL